MSEVAIRVDRISKLYHIGQAARHNTLRDRIVEGVHGLLHRNGKNNRSAALWALKDVSFEISSGEVVGLIGRNGAGKSTLLKVLARITKPTGGRADLFGRVASLLEVGTGFHPELSGRENIYLSGAMLGMTQGEIKRKFDEIIAFSEVEKFLDTPVKRYSSGMYVRLAFAVAAHLEPEIMLVDEVLAVGDASFQAKCLGKMNDIVKQGRTVLFVSHNMGAIQALCPRSLLMRQGCLVMDGETSEVVKEYLSYLSNGAKAAFENNPERSGNGYLRLTGARVLDRSGQSAQHLIAGEPVSFEFTYVNRSTKKNADVNATIYNHLGIAVTNFSTAINQFMIDDLGSQGKFVCRLPNLPLPIGQYRVAVGIQMEGTNADLIPNALIFDVVSSIFYKNGRCPRINYCTCMVENEWRHYALEAAK